MLTQVTHNFSDGHGRKVSHHSVHHNLLWRECYGLGNILLESPAIHVDINLTCDTYLNIVAYQLNPLTIVFPGGIGCNVQKGFEEYYEEIKVFPWLPNSKMSEISIHLSMYGSGLQPF